MQKLEKTRWVESAYFFKSHTPGKSHQRIKAYALVITYKICTARDIPATEVLIEGRGPIKHLSLS
jgi:hypothetical protein